MPERGGGGSAYDGLPDGVVVADADGIVVDVNVAALRMLGDGDWLGQPLAEVLPLIDPQGPRLVGLQPPVRRTCRRGSGSPNAGSR